jgi:hypothetical protein
MPFETVVGDEVEDVQTHQQIIIDHHIRVIVGVGEFLSSRRRKFILHPGDIQVASNV